MKIAISTSGKDLESKVDLRFGRAAGFIIYDIDNDEFEVVDNTQNLNAMQGAGVQAAQNVVNQNVDAIITGHCGPKAFMVLSGAGVKIYPGAEATVKKAIEQFKDDVIKVYQNGFTYTEAINYNRGKVACAYLLKRFQSKSYR